MSKDVTRCCSGVCVHALSSLAFVPPPIGPHVYMFILPTLSYVHEGMCFTVGPGRHPNLFKIIALSCLQLESCRCAVERPRNMLGTLVPARKSSSEGSSEAQNSKNSLSMPALPALWLLCGLASAGPYDLVALQLLEEECPASRDRSVRDAWQEPTIASLEARAHLAGHFGARAARAAALAHWLQALLVLFESHLGAAFQCAALSAQHLQSTAEWSLTLEHPRRARILVQLGDSTHNPTTSLPSK